MNPLIHNTLQFDQYSRFVILLNSFRFAKISKTNLKNAFIEFVEIVETNPLLYNIKDLV